MLTKLKFLKGKALSARIKNPCAILLSAVSAVSICFCGSSRDCSFTSSLVYANGNNKVSEWRASIRACLELFQKKAARKAKSSGFEPYYKAIYAFIASLLEQAAEHVELVHGKIHDKNSSDFEKYTYIFNKSGYLKNLLYYARKWAHDSKDKDLERLTEECIERCKFQKNIDSCFYLAKCFKELADRPVGKKRVPTSKSVAEIIKTPFEEANTPYNPFPKNQRAHTDEQVRSSRSNGRASYTADAATHANKITRPSCEQSKRVSGSEKPREDDKKERLLCSIIENLDARYRQLPSTIDQFMNMYDEKEKHMVNWADETAVSCTCLPINALGRANFRIKDILKKSTGLSTKVQEILKEISDIKKEADKGKKNLENIDRVKNSSVNKAAAEREATLASQLAKKIFNELDNLLLSAEDRLQNLLRG